jgi:uncharacterized OB-fold protein
MAGQRPLPRLNADNRAFWTGGAEGQLRIMRCQDCGTFIHPPQPLCRKCLSENVAAETVAGTGTIYSYSVNHQKWHPDLDVPYVIARVELDGVPGVYLTTNIVGCPVDTVDIGDRVKVTFEQQEDVYIPLFEKVS